MSETVNEHVYIHELVDIIGHARADYVHHMTANWSPLAQETRSQRCYGVWATLGSTGRWPQVVNLWEEDGFDGLADSFVGEAVGPGAQDPDLERWWSRAAEFRRGGHDRLLVPAPWSRDISRLCADGAGGGDCYAHELVRVRPGAAVEFLEMVHDEQVPVADRFGFELVGAFRTAMVDDDECILLWGVPTWADWAAFEQAHVDGDDDVTAWTARARSVLTGRRRTLLVDAPLSPMRTGRQPQRSDRTDWTD